jgi:hypothetical protein
MSYFSGGKQEASGKLRPSLSLRSDRTLTQERAYETTDAREVTLWTQWMAMRDYIWGKAGADAKNVDRNMMIYDLDDVMRKVFDSSLLGDSTIQTMTDKAIATLARKWNYSFIPPPPTPIAPPSLTPVFTSTKHEIKNIFI